MRSIFLSLIFLPLLAPAEVITADLLIVGGNESACAAAVQAARLGVKKIVLVSDTLWFGGQFSSEGVGCLDEWTTIGGKRVNFPRSGLFLEMVQRIRAHNSAKYGKASPGNAYCGTETIEPRAAAEIFDDWLYYEADFQGLSSDGLFIIPMPNKIMFRQLEPVKVEVNEGKVTGVTFEPTEQSDQPKLTVHAKLTHRFLRLGRCHPPQRREIRCGARSSLPLQ
jgi:hypothetical protein